LYKELFEIIGASEAYVQEDQTRMLHRKFTPYCKAGKIYPMRSYPMNALHGKR
jgi:hypothetical protein